MNGISLDGYLLFLISETENQEKLQDQVHE